MLTGQYGHNNGVLSNVPGYGDAERAGEHPARLAAARRLPDRRGRQVAERLREDGRAHKESRRPAGTSGTGWSARPRLLRLQVAVNGKQRKETYEGEYLTDWITERLGST